MIAPQDPLSASGGFHYGGVGALISGLLGAHAAQAVAAPAIGEMPAFSPFGNGDSFSLSPDLIAEMQGQAAMQERPQMGGQIGRMMELAALKGERMQLQAKQPLTPEDNARIAHLDQRIEALEQELGLSQPGQPGQGAGAPGGSGGASGAPTGGCDGDPGGASGAPTGGGKSGGAGRRAGGDKGGGATGKGGGATGKGGGATGKGGGATGKGGGATGKGREATAEDFSKAKGGPKGTFKSKATGYYPSNEGVEGGYVDMKGKKLNTLQDFLQGKASYVSVAMDATIGIPYGKQIRIPELEKRYNHGKPIPFRVVDHGPDFDGRGTKRIDICTASKADSEDPRINSGDLTLIFD